jgi:uncharacterized protein YijF (DUF1287 family)
MNRPSSSLVSASVFALVSIVLPTLGARAEPYARQAMALRQSPSPTATIVDGVDANQSLVVKENHAGWARVRLGVDVEGWVPAALVSDDWIKVWKRERKLFLMKGDTAVQTFRVALGGNNPVGNKVKRGDGATPEGRYFLAELDATPEAARYGARSMRLSYPSVDDARRGLRDRLIDTNTYVSIVRAVRAGEVPPQHTALGGSIRIHGGGSTRDWTLGCIALDDGDVTRLYSSVAKGMRVDVYASADEDQRLGQAGYLPGAILTGAKAQLEAAALYTTAAMRVIPIGFPGGDIPATQAVCSDIVVRALRGAGIDLQAWVFEDRTLHPERYPRRGEPARTVIDHRRVGNLVALLRRHAVAGAMAGSRGLGPGDVVVFDTGIPNGSPFDHIGIVDDVPDSDGHLRAINIWTVGRRTSSMALIGKDYPTVAAWFRLGHPYANR